MESQKSFLLTALLVSSFPASASKEGLQVTVCNSYKGNGEFVIVKRSNEKQYLVKAELGKDTCNYLLSNQVGGYEIPLCEDFSKKHSGANCKSNHLREFFIPAWPENNE